MPELVAPTIAAGRFSQSAQPAIPVGNIAVLRPWKSDDAPALVAAYEDPAIRHWHARRLDSVDEAQRLIADWRGGWSNESRCHWAVADPSTDRVLGRIALTFHDLQDGIGGVAYWMTPAARGNGLCTRAVTALSDWAFNVAGFHRLELEHSTGNAASCRVAVKAGFGVEGTRRGAARHADGWHDMHLHGRLRT